MTPDNPSTASTDTPSTQSFQRVERPPITHELKTWQSYFHALYDGSKNFEVRKFDRDFRVGDYLRLRETEYGSGAYTGRELTKRVTYILAHEEDLGVPIGFAVLSLEAASTGPVVSADLREQLADFFYDRLSAWPNQYTNGYQGDSERAANAVVKFITPFLATLSAQIRAEERAKVAEEIAAWVKSQLTFLAQRKNTKTSDQNSPHATE